MFLLVLESRTKGRKTLIVVVVLIHCNFDSVLVILCRAVLLMFKYTLIVLTLLSMYCLLSTNFSLILLYCAVLSVSV